MKGISTVTAITNLSRVNDRGLMTPDSFAADINDPATNKVTTIAKK